jgi:hypothetical protein
MSTQVQPVQSISSRLVATGTVTLLAGATDTYIGKNNRQDRLQFIVTNLDASAMLKLQTTAKVNLATLFPQRSFIIETRADLKIYNPNGSSVQYEVCELYPDTGNAT